MSNYRITEKQITVNQINQFVFDIVNVENKIVYTISISADESKIDDSVQTNFFDRAELISKIKASVYDLLNLKIAEIEINKTP